MKKFQNTLNMIRLKIFFCFLFLYEQIYVFKTVTFWLEFTLSFYKNVLKQTWKAFNTKLGP